MVKAHTIVGVQHKWMVVI